jgi:hypothetical protein
MKKFLNPKSGSIFEEADIEHMLEECTAVRSRLSEWEQEFIESMTEQFADKTHITEKQLVILERIYARYTS